MRNAELRVDLVRPQELEPLLAELAPLDVAIFCHADRRTLALCGEPDVIASALDALQRWLAAIPRESVVAEVDGVPYAIRAGAWVPRPRPRARVAALQRLDAH